MRFARQNKIIELISEYEIDTQEKLAGYLAKNGFEVTQATVSRDIKELQLVKTPASSDKYKYTLPERHSRQTSDKYSKIFRDTAQSAACSGNIIIVKTLAGCANAACEAIDSLEYPHILGSLAGDNTVFIVCDDPRNALPLVERFQGMLSE